MRLVFISDTHGMHRQVSIPACDILVHCGDITNIGELDQLAGFNAWARQLKRAGQVREVVAVAGNHDISLDESHPKVTPWLCEKAQERLSSVIYLQDAEATVLGLRFYGTPWTPRFFDWAFQLDGTIQELRRFEPIPDGLDVLVTHGPPLGIRDECDDGRRVGSRYLAEVVRRAAPRVHAFGHIHHSHGVEGRDATTYVNAATCTERYQPTNTPIVVEL